MKPIKRIAVFVSLIAIFFLIVGGLLKRGSNTSPEKNSDQPLHTGPPSPHAENQNQTTTKTSLPKEISSSSPELRKRALNQLHRLMAGDTELSWTKEEFAFDPETRTALNPAQRLALRFEEDGSVSASALDEGGWSWSMRPSGLTTSPNVSFEKDRVARVISPGVEEWFTNDERGLEQGFEIASAEAVSTEGTDSRVIIDFETDLKGSLEFDEEGKELLAFLDDSGRAQLYYHGLVVNDATGRELPSHFETKGESQVALVYESANAVYPVTIDPIVSRELASFQGRGGFINGNLTDSFAEMNGEIYFSMNDQSSGEELWKTDLTLEGTRLVKDIAPGIAASRPQYFVVFNEELYFMAYQEGIGYELWKSDGTEAGTTLVADINPGIESSAPNNLIVLDGSLYFAADGDSNGDELWKSDGTETGTVLVKDIDSRTGNFAGSNPRNFAVMGDSLYFVAYSPNHGREVWKSDGTEAGTILLKDINPGTGFSNPADLIAINGTLFFKARGSGGEEVWKSDGTTSGTVLLKDISPGGGSSSPRYLTALGSKLVFTAWNDSGQEIWVSDGTSDGTTILKDINPGSSSSNPQRLTAALGHVFFSAFDQINRYQLWSTDGTASGTAIVANLPGTVSTQIASLSADVPGSVLFIRGVFQQPHELLRTDGTEAGTVMIRSTGSPDFAGGGGYFLQGVNGNAVFTASDGNSGFELWKSDGTTEGTVPFAETNPTRGINNFLRTDEMIYFAANDGVNGEELWKSDGTIEGTERITDINPGSGDSSPQTPVWYENQLFFSASDSSSNHELWKSTGEVGNFELVKEINADTGPSYPSNLTVFDGALLFSATDSISGIELWKSDGSESGTVMLKDINAGPSGSINKFLGEIGGEFLFHADDEVHGRELWKTDGTADGTVMVKDIYAGDRDATFDFPTIIDDTLYFRSDDGTTGFEFWKTDGTEAGTALVKEAQPGSFSGGTFYLTAHQNKIFYSARNSDAPFQNNELWVSDGTEDGTHMVRDIYPGPQGSGPLFLYSVGDFLLFFANDGVNGYELWRSDGTEAGTSMVKELLPGSDNFLRPIDATNAIVADGVLYFAMHDGVSGLELWMSDGTADGTTLVEDTVPGYQGSVPIPIGKIGEQFFFVGSTGLGGNLTLRVIGEKATVAPDPDTPVLSGSDPKTDLLIGEKVRKMRGDNVYHQRKAGRKQTLRMSGNIFRTHRARVALRLENDGSGRNSSQFHLRARGTRNPGISTRAYVRKPGGGRKVITGAMKRRGYTCNLAGGESVRISYQMTTNRFWAGVRDGRGRRENQVRFTAISKGSTDNCGVRVLFR